MKKHNFRMGPAVAQQTAATPKFWNMASVSDDEGEITLYGDVVSRQPVDWWTGEEVPGLFITPEGFMEDLAAVKNKSKITVKLNSCGGDLYTGIAIHNALKALSGEVNVVVEGIAASAASVIMCAGDTVTVYVRDLDAEKRKISLGYRKAEDNPWEIFKANYDVDDVVDAKIVGMTAFGAFAQIIPGIDGLIHISQIADRRIDKPQDELKVGQEVKVKITNVDFDNKRISLSIRALLETAPVAEEVAEEAAAEEETAE